jgi:hypothetical protein
MRTTLRTREQANVAGQTIAIKRAAQRSESAITDFINVLFSDSFKFF